MQRLEAIVVGAGHAGLAVSHELADAGIDHLVLERGRLGETWRSQRWDSFRLNTPSWMNRLPGEPERDIPQPADGFQSAPGFVDRLAAYAAASRLPVREGVTVSRISPDDGGFVVEVGGEAGDRLSARSVVVASGIQNVPVVPAIATVLPSSVTQLHSSAYRSSAALPGGGVLVVGSGQTGGQIVDELLDAGRDTWLSPSRVARCRRRRRGRDVLEWLVPGGFYDVPLEQLPDPAMRYARQPLISGVGRHGHSISLQWLASRGARLVGRIRGIEGGTLALDDTVADCIRFGDRGSADLCGIIDKLIEAAGVEPGPLEDDPADQPHPDPDTVRSPARLDLGRTGIRTVIWATGVAGAFGWLPPEVLGADGTPVHERGETTVPGLFVHGFPWLTNRGSGIIYGAAGDARRISALVAARAR